MGGAAEEGEGEEDWSPMAPMIASMTTAAAPMVVGRVRLRLVL